MHQIIFEKHREFLFSEMLDPFVRLAIQPVPCLHVAIFLRFLFPFFVYSDIQIKKKRNSGRPQVGQFFYGKQYDASAI